MADLPSIKKNITVEQTQTYAAATVATAQSMGGACNWIQDNVNATPLGSVVPSMLTEAQFQSYLGTGWKLCNGQSAAGTAYQTLTGFGTVPDVRACFLRGKKNSRADGKGRGTENALGTYTADDNDSHTHSTSITKNEVGKSNGTLDVESGSDRFNPIASFTASINCGLVTGASAWAEMRPDLSLINYFIRVD